MIRGRIAATVNGFYGIIRESRRRENGGAGFGASSTAAGKGTDETTAGARSEYPLDDSFDNILLTESK